MLQRWKGIGQEQRIQTILRIKKLNFEGNTLKMGCNFFPEKKKRKKASSSDWSHGVVQKKGA